MFRQNKMQDKQKNRISLQFLYNRRWLQKQHCLARGFWTTGPTTLWLLCQHKRPKQTSVEWRCCIPGIKHKSAQIYWKEIQSGFVFVSISQTVLRQLTLLSRHSPVLVSTCFTLQVCIVFWKSFEFSRQKWLILYMYNLINWFLARKVKIF